MRESSADRIKDTAIIGAEFDAFTPGHVKIFRTRLTSFLRRLQMKAASKKSSRTSARIASEKSEFIRNLAALFALAYFKAPSTEKDRLVRKFAKDAEELIQHWRTVFDKASAVDQTKIDKASVRVVKKLDALIPCAGVCIGATGNDRSTCEANGGHWKGGIPPPPRERPDMKQKRIKAEG
jgi:hypothetical protein